MIWFVAISVMIWFLGAKFGAPVRQRWAIIVVLYVVVLVALWMAPAGGVLGRTVGGTPGEWLVIGGLVLMIWGYRRGLHALRNRARPKADATRKGTFSDGELERYARHIVLREIGGSGQKKLKAARVLVVGAGGLGSPALLYLAAAGVGTIGVIDDDVVDNSNLQRQVIHTDGCIGMPKVFSAEAAMMAQNPSVRVHPYNRRLSEGDASALFFDYDLVLDGTDNFDTRYLVNRTCAALGKPLISGALTQWEGQISTFDPKRGAPCYACIFPHSPADGLAPSCAEAGVLGPLPGVIGAMMAVEAVKEIAQAGEGLRGRMLIYDALYGETRMITLKRSPDCDVCSGVDPIT